MPATQKPVRYGHTEGHTDVCFDDSGSCIVTCGSDGDVRIWEDLDDDDPKSINVGEKAYSCALKNGKLVTAVSNNTVQVHTFPEGVPDGILTRFTTNANHVIFNGDGTKIAAGSSDFLVKIVDVVDCSQQKTFRGHDAPVLSLSFDPKDIFLASASCDGSVRVWHIPDQTCAISWPLLQKCNDVVNAKSICRLAWQPKSGKLLAIPVEKSVKLYRRETWSNQFDLSDSFISQEKNVTMLKTGLLKEEEEDDQAGSSHNLPLVTSQRPFYDGPMPTPRQKPFQSGSTPLHLTHRFMVWNSIGIIRCYNDEQDNAIDVEFHDTSIHHATHLSNSLNYTVADLSHEAILLASESTDELASKLHCLHFSSWDSSKEWMVDMPQHEDIEAICLGQGWAAAATSALLLRLFSIGGVQKEIFSLPGPVVSMAGHGEQLLIVFHRGRIFSQFYNLTSTPCYVDSEGCVRMLNRAFGNTWTPVCNTREHCKGKSDHYWVVGIHEHPQQLRCIPCKGSRFPPTLPRPAVAILSFKLPYCQIATEKGQMEEQFWRSVIFHNHLDYLAKNGYEYLSCKLEREFRCVELAELMTQHAVNLAVKYASRSRKLILAQKLSELAVEKASELAATQAEEEEVEEEDFRKKLSAGYSNAATEWDQPRLRNQTEEDTESRKEADDTQKTPELHEHGQNSGSTDTFDVPAIKSGAVTSSNQGRINPFKVSASSKEPAMSVNSTRSTNILDTMNKSSKKSTAFNRATNNEKSPVIKPLIPKPKSKQASAASFFQKRPCQVEKTEEVKEENPKNASSEAPVLCPQNVENQRPKTGFQMWLEENRSNILSDNPDFSEEADIIKEGMIRFRALSTEERKAWTNKAK
ncbi:PREDICTED: WD repeat and HMG-box DNA-binding protein 1 [Dipodomys ordii]|uniref:WD repeat and HMG-box DNA-binding protein 1 n=1 Tax=Dipodomys ordii TaxID=10020 RepID=A0A1S3EUS0_DIPOR|nr:PREDICTED: WD repeat and HMG-box DNA-binding protein 1 [Dipodomys ordii]